MLFVSARHAVSPSRSDPWVLALRGGLAQPSSTPYCPGSCGIVFHCFAQTSGGPEDEPGKDPLLRRHCYRRGDRGMWFHSHGLGADRGGGGRFCRLQLWFSDRLSGLLPPAAALPVLSPTVSSASIRLSTAGVSSAPRQLYAAAVETVAADLVYPAARLDRRLRPTVSGIQSDPRYRRPRESGLRHGLPRPRRPMAHRQLMTPRPRT